MERPILSTTVEPDIGKASMISQISAQSNLLATRMEETGKHMVGSGTYMSLPGTGLSSLFEPLSYDFDAYASTLQSLNIPYSFGSLNPDAQFQEFDSRPPPSTDEFQKQLSPNAINSTCIFRDSEGEEICVSAEAKLNGTFFFAEVEDEVQSPAQLTCYRRNIFGVSGRISFPCSLGKTFNANGEETAISGAQVCVSAFESTRRRATELVHVPLRAIGSSIQFVEEATVSIPLSSGRLSGEDQQQNSPCTFPFEWKRLQFRKATANNGGRRGVQQQFQIKASLIVTLETGATTTVAEIESNPLVVRGRNPGNFIQERASATTASLTLRQRAAYKPTEIMNSLPSPAGTNTTYKQQATSELNEFDPCFALQNYATTASTILDLDERSSWLDFGQEDQDLQALGAGSPSKKSPHTTFSTAYSLSPTNSLPISHQPQKITAHDPSAQNMAEDVDSTLKSVGTTSTPSNTHQSPWSRSIPPARVEPRADTTESSEPLYEYFPLGLNGWMPPVDAVYRPHVAHNTVLVPELKGLMIK